MKEEEIRKILWLSGLKNAVKFNGTPNKKAIMGKFMASKPDLRSQAKIIIPTLDQIINEILELDLEEQKRKELANYFKDVLFLKKELRESLVEKLEEDQKHGLLMN